MAESRMSVREAEALVLRKETVEVKPIVREASGFFKKGHDGEFMYTGTTKTYQLPFSMNTHSYVKIFASAKEQEAFEVLMSKEPGALNIYDRDNKFWLSFRVELTKEGKVLDLSNVTHALEHRVLQANSNRIAPDWNSRNKPSYEFALVNDKQVEEAKIKTTQALEKAMDLFMNIRKSNSKMFNMLRLLEKMPSKDMIDKTEFLKSELISIIEEKLVKTGVKNVHDFIKVAEDPRFNTKVLIYDAIDANEISMRNGIFRLNMTDVVMGKSIEQVADWLDALQNQEEKIILQQRLEKPDSK